MKRLGLEEVTNGDGTLSSPKLRAAKGTGTVCAKHPFGPLRGKRSQSPSPRHLPHPPLSRKRKRGVIIGEIAGSLATMNHSMKDRTDRRSWAGLDRGRRTAVRRCLSGGRQQDAGPPLATAMRRTDGHGAGGGRAAGARAAYAGSSGQDELSVSPSIVSFGKASIRRTSAPAMPPIHSVAIVGGQRRAGRSSIASKARRRPSPTGRRRGHSRGQGAVCRSRRRGRNDPARPKSPGRRASPWSPTWKKTATRDSANSSD